MSIKKNSHVSLLINIKDEDGLLLELNESDVPLDFIQGSNSLLPAVEEAVFGKSAGDEINLVLPPGKGFGYKDKALTRIVPLDKFSDVENALQPGDMFILDDNNPLTWTVISVKDEEVFLDANNAWAGKTLHIWVKIIAVSDAEMAPGENLIFRMKPGIESCSPGCCC